MYLDGVLKERLQNSDKQEAIDLYYELLSSGYSVGEILEYLGDIQCKPEHGNITTAEPPPFGLDGMVPMVTSEAALIAAAQANTWRTPGLTAPLRAESCRIEEPPATESAPLKEFGSGDWEQLRGENLREPEPNIVRSAAAYTSAGSKIAVPSNSQEPFQSGKFSNSAKRIAFGALYAVAVASASIASFAIVSGSRNADPTTTRVQSDISSRTEVVAIPGPAADRSEAVVKAQKSQKQVANVDSSQAHEPSRPAKPESAVPGTLQKLTVGVREPGSAVQQEVGAPKRSNVGQVDAIQQSTAPVTAPRDPAHKPTPSVAQSLSATPRGSVETAPHSDTGQPPEAVPKDEPKATTTVPTKNVSAALPSRSYAAKRRRASTPHRDAGSRWHIRQQTPAKYP